VTLAYEEGEHSCYVLSIVSQVDSKGLALSCLLDGFQAIEFGLVGNFSDGIFAEQGWHSRRIEVVEGREELVSLAVCI
jgi:hypothetical protein